ncbi:MAG: hypothetical protein Q9203_001229 [Teloschistes exilis]
MVSAPIALATLPVEILLNIFRHADDFATVNAFLRSSGILHRTWLVHANSIALAVLPNAIECYDEARELSEAQAHTEALQTLPPKLCKSNREAAIALCKRFFRNADIVATFYKNYVIPAAAEINTVGHWNNWPLVDRSRLLRTLYRLKTLCVLHDLQDANSLDLVAIGPQDLIDLCDVARWIRFRTPVERRSELGLEHLTLDYRWFQKWLDSCWASMGRSCRDQGESHRRSVHRPEAIARPPVALKNDVEEARSGKGS